MDITTTMPEIKTGDPMFSRSEKALKSLVSCIAKFSISNFFKLSIFALKPQEQLSMYIMLGMIILAWKKGLMPKNKLEWPLWIYDNIWSHGAMAFPDETGLHIKESVAQGFRRRRFSDHYSFNPAAVKFMRFKKPLSASQIKRLIEESDKMIAENKGYQYLSIIAWAVEIIKLLIGFKKSVDKDSKTDLFIDTEKFTICYESLHRLEKAIFPLDFKGNSEKASLFDIYKPDLMDRVY